MKLSETLSYGRKRLEAAGIDTALIECEHMFMCMLDTSRASLYLMADNEIASHNEKQFHDWLDGREKRIPLAYLLGDVFFHSLKLKVRPGCLIPRPETEQLVDAIAAVLKSDHIAAPVIADIGCGSGAIGLALRGIFPDARLVMTDVSSPALEITKSNAEQLQYKDIQFYLSDLFQAPVFLNTKFDAIVSNPPYLTQADMQALQPEVAHEPREALDGGLDGLDFYRRIIPEAKKHLKPGGSLGLEIGFGQAEAVQSELEKNGYNEIQVFKDHQQIERVLTARYRY